jgi:hypothetical protein
MPRPYEIAVTRTQVALMRKRAVRERPEKGNRSEPPTTGEEPRARRESKIFGPANLHHEEPMKKANKSAYQPLSDAQRRDMVRHIIDTGQQSEFPFCRDLQPLPKNSTTPKPRKRKRGEDYFD